MEPTTAENTFSRTPPEKLQLPPSPPASSERSHREGGQQPHGASAAEELQHRRTISPDAHAADQLTTFEISPTHPPYEVLCDTEDRPFWTTYSENSVVYVMPSGVHEAVRIGAEKIIADQVQDWQIQPLGSASIKLEGCNVKAQQPDAQFVHEDQMFPGLVMEVAHSQPTKDAVKHMKNYIYGTYGQIRSAILISIKSPPEESLLSHWRATFVPSAGTMSLRIEEDFHKVFRASDGSKVNKDARLTIPLSDFGLQVAREARGVDVRCEEIFDLVVQAEARQARKRSQEQAPGTPAYKRIRREKLSSSSPEQLQNNREELFERAENHAEKEAERQSDYEASWSDSDAQPEENKTVSSRLRAKH